MKAALLIILAASVLGLAATFGSLCKVTSVDPRVAYPYVLPEECETALAWGWPLPFVVDNPEFPNTDLLGTEDIACGRRLALNWLVWTVGFSAAVGSAGWLLAAARARTTANRMGAVRSPMNSKHKTAVIVCLVVLAVIAVWFVAVDRSWFVEYCPDCYYGRYIRQYRVFGFAVHESVYRDEPSPMGKVAADLGVPCTHPALVRWHKYRWWGLCILGWPAISGTSGMSSDEGWYDEAKSGKVKRLAELEPSLPGEFRQRVLREHDWVYWQALVKQIRTETSEGLGPEGE